MLMDYKENSKDFLSDLSLELIIKRTMRNINDEFTFEDNKKYIEQAMSFFKVIMDFCEKKHSVMQNKISGVEAFSIFVSALENSDIDINDTNDVFEIAKTYYNFLRKVKNKKILNSEEKERLVEILEQINRQIDLNLSKSNQHNKWRF